MKIQKAQFKSIIKECLKELIAEGALDHMVASVISEGYSRPQQPAMNPADDPRIKLAAMQASGGNPAQAQIMEQIFRDTVTNTLPDQQAAWNNMSNGAFGMDEMGGANINAMMQQAPVANRNPLPPRDPQAVQMLAERAQANNQPTNAFSTTWARLAFNSPISNRPSSNRGLGGNANFLPGTTKNSSF